MEGSAVRSDLGRAHLPGRGRAFLLAGVTFVIGGAFGLGAPVLKKARRKLSLSTLTLPHEMARLLLAEQLYRAGTLLRGEPYHKA